MNNVPAALNDLNAGSTNPVDVLSSWKAMAWDRFERNGYPALKDFYEGYATALEDSLRLLKAQAADVVEEADKVAEVVKESHKLRTLVLVGVVVGGVYVYKKRKENKEK